MIIEMSMKSLFNTLSVKFHDFFINFDKSKRHQYSKSIYYKLYISSYKTGEYTLEFAEKLTHLINNFWYFTLSELYSDLSKKFSKALEYKKSSFGRGEFSIMKSLINICNNITYILSETIKGLKKNPIYGIHTFGNLILSSLKTFWACNKRYFNYAAPLIGVIILSLTISFWTHNKFALKVTYNGKQLGYIQSEQIFRTAVTDVEQSVKNCSGTTFALKYTPSFNLVITNTNSFEDSQKLSESIIKNSSTQLMRGYGLYVANNLLGVNKDEAALKKTLENILATYRKNTPGENVAFVQNVVIEKGIFPNENVKSIDNINKIITSNVVQQQIYTAVKRDSPSAISTKLKIPLSKLYFLNPTLESKKVIIGQKILIEASRSYLSVKVITNETFTQVIAFSVKNVSNNQIYQSQKKIAVKGINGQARVNSAVTYINGVSVDKQILSQTVIKPPIAQVVYIGTKPKPTTVASGIFAWPVSRGIGYISCPFGGYRGHSGMDIACNQGTPILAADAGTVQFAGWDGGYGFCVWINHGNGYVTVYGHASKLLVTTGTKVFKGQLIALVGHTGNVRGRTGNHVHFEVQINVVAVNPAKFLQAR
jgi:murein DD-endopeptidase MepM/ murein hydrolase activator NlpD